MQYYGIKDYTSESPFFIATLTLGLPIGSRVMTKLSGQDYPIEFYIQAMICDRLTDIWWSKTDMKGQKPKLLCEILASKDKKNDKYEVFASGDDFKAEWERLSRKGAE